MISALKRFRYGSIVVLATAIVVLGLIVENSFYLRIAALVWTMSIATIGLNVLMGEAGQVSLGHAAFIGFGSYAVSLGPPHLGLDPLLCVLLGLVVSGAVAYVIGRPVLRLEGYYLSVATLGLGYLVSLVIISETAITGGPDGMAVPRISVFGMRLTDATTWYWISAACLVVAALLAINLSSGPTGRAFRALHDSETAAAALGVDVASKKLIAFVLAAVYASFAGSLLALMNGFAAPSSASFLQSIELVAMVVIGGTGSVVGAVIGTAVLIVLPQLFTAFHDYETLLVGLMIMVFMIFLRQGIVPGVTRLAGVRT